MHRHAWSIAVVGQKSINEEKKTTFPVWPNTGIEALAGSLLTVSQRYGLFIGNVRH
jgi:hypothetical protein